MYIKKHTQEDVWWEALFGNVLSVLIWSSFVGSILWLSLSPIFSPLSWGTWNVLCGDELSTRVVWRGSGRLVALAFFGVVWKDAGLVRGAASVCPLPLGGPLWMEQPHVLGSWTVTWEKRCRLRLMRSGSPVKKVYKTALGSERHELMSTSDTKKDLPKSLNTWGSRHKLPFSDPRGPFHRGAWTPSKPPPPPTLSAEINV